MRRKTMTQMERETMSRMEEELTRKLAREALLAMPIPNKAAAEAWLKIAFIGVGHADHPNDFLCGTVAQAVREVDDCFNEREARKFVAKYRLAGRRLGGKDGGEDRMCKILTAFMERFEDMNAAPPKGKTR
jgi:hypothetical protein